MMLTCSSPEILERSTTVPARAMTASTAAATPADDSPGVARRRAAMDAATVTA